MLFRDIAIGEKFVYNKDLFIRTDEHPLGSGVMNVVRLKDGGFCEFWDSTEVEKMAICVKYGNFPNGLVRPDESTGPKYNYNIYLCTDCLDLIKKLTGMDFEELTIGRPLWPIPCQLCGEKTTELHFIRKRDIVKAMKKLLEETKA